MNTSALATLSANRNELFVVAKLQLGIRNEK